MLWRSPISRLAVDLSPLLPLLLNAQLKFCNAFNSHLWALLNKAEKGERVTNLSGDDVESTTTKFFTETFTATASDDLLNQALKGLKGTACMETLVSLFFEIRGAFVARPEPLLPDDVHVSK